MTTMVPLTARQTWKALEAHHGKIRDLHLRTLFADDATRGERLTAEAVGIYLDYSVALNQLIRQADITWHGVRLHEPDWRHCSHSVAFTARFTTERVFIHVILNAYWEPLEFELPLVASGGRDPWCRWIDTFLDSPHDIVDWERAPSVRGRTYRTEPRSVVVLFARLDPERESGKHG